MFLAWYKVLFTHNAVRQALSFPLYGWAAFVRLGTQDLPDSSFQHLVNSLAQWGGRATPCGTQPPRKNWVSWLLQSLVQMFMSWSQKPIDQRQLCRLVSGWQPDWGVSWWQRVCESVWGSHQVPVVCPDSACQWSRMCHPRWGLGALEERGSPAHGWRSRSTPPAGGRGGEYNGPALVCMVWPYWPTTCVLEDLRHKMWFCSCLGGSPRVLSLKAYSLTSHGDRLGTRVTIITVSRCTEGPIHFFECLPGELVSSWGEGEGCERRLCGEGIFY